MLPGLAIPLGGSTRAALPTRTLVYDAGVLTTGTSITTPKGATYCEVAIGGGGGGGMGTLTGQGTAGFGGGGAAFARSGFNVAAGDVIAYSIGTAGTQGSYGGGVPGTYGSDGGPSSVTYRGAIQALADSGKGTGISGAASASIGNIETRSGTPGNGQVGGTLPNNSAGVTPYPSVGGPGGAASGSGYSSGGGGAAANGNTGGNAQAGFVAFRFYSS